MKTSPALSFQLLFICFIVPARTRDTQLKTTKAKTEKKALPLVFGLSRESGLQPSHLWVSFKGGPGRISKIHF